MMEAPINTSEHCGTNTACLACLADPDTECATQHTLVWKKYYEVPYNNCVAKNDRLRKAGIPVRKNCAYLKNSK